MTKSNGEPPRTDVVDLEAYRRINEGVAPDEAFKAQPTQEAPKKTRGKPKPGEEFDEAFWEGKRDEAVEELNNLGYAILMAQNEVTIMRERPNEGITYLDQRSLTLWYMDDALPVLGTNGQRWESKAMVWLKSKRRQKYQGIEFNPTETTPGYYNLWKGFAVKPNRKGSWDKLRRHMWRNLCKRDSRKFRWLIAWLADMIQNPNRKVGVVMVFRGGKGTGKSILARFVCGLMPSNGMTIAKRDQLTGRFNGHFIGKLFICVEEAAWAGDKDAEGVLKDMITNETIAIERKGKDVESYPSYLRVMMSSNADWVVPASVDERRFTIFDVGDEQKQNHAYFSALIKQMEEEGGLEGFLHFLQSVDRSKLPNPMKYLTTDELIQQKIESLDQHHAFFLDLLSRGAAWAGTGNAVEINEGYPTVMTRVLYDEYIHWCEKWKVFKPWHEAKFGKNLATILKGAFVKDRPTINGKQTPVYRFQDIGTCRWAFENWLGGKVEWSDSF